MRLTSRNIAIRSLKARKCLADMTARMWAYMEEGDTENALCVRKKAIGLLGLIRTAERWRPTIVNGYRNSIHFDLSPVTHPSAFIVDSISINGIKVVPRFIAYGGTQDVVAKQVRAANCNIPADDDTVAVRYIRTGNLSFRLETVSTLPLTSLDGVNSGGASGSPIADVITGNEEFSDAQPPCLTDAQILAVVGKMDELCDCKC